MTMNDPRSSPPRAPYERVQDNTMGWVIGSMLGALLVVGGIWWAMSHRTNTASTLPPSQTTGQRTDPAPMAPATPALPPASAQPRNIPDPNPLPGEEPRPIPR